LLELVLGVLVNVFLVVGDDGFGDSLADGVDLRGVTSTGDTHADVDVGCDLCISMLRCARGLFLCRRVRTELVHADDQDGLVDLESQRLRLDQAEGLAVDLDKSFTGLYVATQYTVSRVRGRGIGGVPCSGRQLCVSLATISIILSRRRERLESVPVAVFFLPKHCTLWEAMLGDCGLRAVGGCGFVNSLVVDVEGAQMRLWEDENSSER
jgi:hypothetical protein